MPRKRNRPEDAIQRAVFLHLTVRGAKGVYAFHVPNQGTGNRKRGAILKGLGVKAGVPDIIAIHEGRVYAMELKAPKGGRATEVQLEALSALQRAGAYTAVCVGLDRALRTLEGWGLLRGTTT